MLGCGLPPSSNAPSITVASLGPGRFERVRNAALVYFAAWPLAPNRHVTRPEHVEAYPDLSKPVLSEVEWTHHERLDLR